MDVETAMEEVEELFELLPEQDRGALVEALRERLAGQGEGRRPRRLGKDMPPVRPSDIVRDRRGPAVSLPSDRDETEEDRRAREDRGEGAEDRRQGRRYANDSAAGLPSFNEIWGTR